MCSLKNIPFLSRSSTASNSSLLVRSNIFDDGIETFGMNVLYRRVLVEHV